MNVDAGLAWRDGDVVPIAEATLPVLSHAVQRGTTVFDVLRTVDVDADSSLTVGDAALAAFGLRPHVARFFRSMGLMGMTPTLSVGDVEQAVHEVAAAFGRPAVIKLIAAWAEVPPSAMPVSTTPSIWVTATDGLPQGDRTKTVKTAVAPKLTPEMLPPSLKVAASYTIGVREKMAAIAEDFDDVIFKTVTDDLAEGTTQSVFVVIDGSVVVPPLDAVLDGITRRMVLDVAAAEGITVDVRPIAWDEVLAADELFCCSTNGPVEPITRHDDRELAAPGPVSKQLRAAVDLVLSGQHALSTRWLAPIS